MKLYQKDSLICQVLEAAGKLDQDVIDAWNGNLPRAGPEIKTIQIQPGLTRGLIYLGTRQDKLSSIARALAVMDLDTLGLDGAMSLAKDIVLFRDWKIGAVDQRTSINEERPLPPDSIFNKRPGKTTIN